MKHQCTSLAMLAVTLLAAPALAQDAIQPVTRPMAQTQLDTETTASTGAAADFAAVMNALTTSNNSANAIQALSAIGKVQIVKVADIASADDMKRLDQAVAEHQSDITGLQAAIMANSALKKAVDAKSVDTSNIVAASIEADGAVTVFVK